MARKQGRVRTLDDARNCAEAAELYMELRNYRAVADQLDVNVSTAYRRCQTAIRLTVSPAAEALRAQETERALDAMGRLYEVVEADHPVVSDGRIVTVDGSKLDEGGIPLLDDGPIVTALREIRAWSERLAKLHGLDAATAAKIQVTGKDDGPVQISGDQAREEALAYLNEIRPQS